MANLQVTLVPQLESRDSTATKGAGLTNAYIEGQGQELPRAVKRPGVGSPVLYSAGTAQGLVTHDGVSIVVVNDRFYTSSVAYTAIVSGGLPVDFA